MSMPHLDNITVTVDSIAPLKVEEGHAKHSHFQWREHSGTFVKRALQKHGGSIGHFITDAIRFYWWYMSVTDSHSLVAIPHGKMSSTLRTEMDRVGAQTVELHS